MLKSHKYFIIKSFILFVLFIILYPLFCHSNVSALDPKKETLQSENNIIFLDTCGSNNGETCATPSGNNITWIGDSYSVGAKNEIEKKFPGVDLGSDSDPYIHCSKHIKAGDSDTNMNTCSKAGYSGIELARKIKNANKMRSYLIFALSTNDPNTNSATITSYIEELMGIVGTDTQVVFVTARTENGNDYSGVNEAYRSASSKYSNASVADWDKSDQYKSDFFAADKLHPYSNGGYETWVNIISEALPSEGNCASAGSVKALQDKVLELAWADGSHGTDKKPEYDEVVQKYASGQVEGYSYVGGCSGVDCGAWVSILMRESGWDPEYNAGGGPTSSQLKYLQESDKWESLNALGTDIPEDQLKPGDVAVNDGHTYAYVGEIDGFATHIASASLCGRAPCAGSESPGDGSYYWFRKKDTGGDTSTTSGNANQSSSSSNSDSFNAETFIKSSNNKIYDNSRDIWTEEEAKNIESLYPLYKKAADEVGIPWQFLAVVHRLETGQSRTNPNNGQGLFQDFYQTRPDLYTPGATVDDDNFTEQAKIAAESAKAAGISTDSDDGAIKKVFFSYNGRASAYIAQAKALGFSDEEASNGDGSPYVMNYADEKRDPEKNPSGWGQIKTDGGAISYPANTSFVGAFIMYAALAGFSPTPSGSDDQCCSDPVSTKTDLGDFTKYTDMTDDQLLDLLDVAVRENSSSLNALKTELSIMANLFERNGGDRPQNATGFCDYIKTGGWFNGNNAALIGDGTHDDHPTEYIEAARDIYVNGNRTLPVEINEHDCLADECGAGITRGTNNGTPIDLHDTSQYQRGVTVLENNLGSTYTFWAFADDEAKTGDPFGYTGDAPAEIPETGENNTTTGNTSVECCDSDSKSSSSKSSSSNSSSCGSSVSSDVKALQDKAKELAWEDGRYTLERKPAYIEAVDRARFSGASCNGGGVDCGGWVTILMIESGWDPDYNPNNGATGDQLAYVQSSDKWQEVYPPGSATLEGDLQPGDVFVKSGHTFAYVGDVEGTAGPFTEASMCQWAPNFTSSPALSSEMGVYRKVK